MEERRAGFWVRFVALLIDSVILGIVQGILIAIFGMRSATTTLLLIIISLLYNVWYQSRNGQTIGKKIMGIQVLKKTGEKVTIGTMLLREIIGKALSGLILFIGYLMAAGKQKRALHDYIAGTVVVRTE